MNVARFPGGWAVLWHGQIIPMGGMTFWSSLSELKLELQHHGLAVSGRKVFSE